MTKAARRDCRMPVWVQRRPRIARVHLWWDRFERSSGGKGQTVFYGLGLHRAWFWRVQREERITPHDFFVKPRRVSRCALDREEIWDRAFESASMSPER